MPEDPLVSNVSDTARWVAAYRASESARPDALFRDPYADRLAGARGRAIAAAMPRPMQRAWPMVVRTRVIDDLIQASIGEGCDCILNLAAGLDTRPYRMDLPESLSWVEADFAPLMDEKEKLLAGEKPRCQLRREPVDLSDPEARTAFLLRAASGVKRALVLTEGLLMYLDETVVRAIGHDLRAQPNVAWWILDLHAPAIRDMLMKQAGAHLDNAPIKFAPPDGVAFFETLGWRAEDIKSIVREGVRLRRIPTLLRFFASVFPDPDPRKLGHARWSAIVRFVRA